jgi:AcrR family transcriptional regulator
VIFVKTMNATRKAAERRQSILEVASEVFLSEGYSAAAMADIAQQLGGSKGTLYSYFPSKQELFFAVIEDRAERALDHFVPLEDTATLETALIAIGHRFLDSVLNPTSIAFYRLLISEAGRFPEIGALFYAQHRQRLVSSLAPHLQREVDIPGLGFADHLELGELFYDLCAGSIHRRTLMGIAINLKDADLDSHVRQTATMFLKLCDVKAS